MVWIYNLLIVLTFPLWVPWMLLRASRRSEKVDWNQRLGDYRLPKRDPARPRLWLHAVSVGEVVAARPVLRALRRRMPEAEVVLSVTTSSGHRTARETAEGLYDHLVYFPIDVPRFTIGALVRVRPAVVAIMETELWMNFLWACDLVEAETFVINARMSDGAFRRAKFVRFFYRSLLSYVDRVLAQTETDAERFRFLGAREVEVLGNTKFDEAADALPGADGQDRVDLRQQLGFSPDDPVIVVGSTRSEIEEHLVRDTLLDPSLAEARVVWAPRHIERAGHVEACLRVVADRHGGEVRRRSAAETGKYLVLDTYGELARLYAVGDVVVVGGGFDRLGGQNILQPLAHGKPVVHGPHMGNFRDVSRAALRAGASFVAADSTSLAATLSNLLIDAERRRECGDAGRALVESNLGASEHYAEILARALEEAKTPASAKV
ncbi:MAG: hypothetical protein KIT11_04550 [Fimbriimonadaceae bacterium]|nr:hypothetical protein [Fimbriimonadaceae bacterium]QYK56836.1 MAG: hypothetical protein KF733_04975 [Fimbriimonadaceae bacterium]